MNKNRIILGLGTVFIIIAIGLSAFSLIMVTTALNKLSVENTEENIIESEKKTIPINEWEQYDLEESIIATYSTFDDKGDKKTLNVSMKIGFALDSNSKETEELLILMKSKEGVIRDRISKLLETKTYEFMNDKSSTEILQNELLKEMQSLFNTDAIIEVYFAKNLKSVK